MPNSSNNCSGNVENGDGDREEGNNNVEESSRYDDDQRGAWRFAVAPFVVTTNDVGVGDDGEGTLTAA